MAISPSDLLAIAATPIRPDRPGGDSVTYEPEFEAIKTEIGKLDSLSGEQPNWGEVEANALTLLKGKAKDFTVGSYLVLSLFRTGGYAGLATGLQFYRDLLTNFWDTGLPEMARMRGRVAAVTWMNDRISGGITRKTPTSSDSEAVKACLEAFKEVNALVGDKFGNDAPSLGDLRRSLDEAGRAVAPPPAAATSAASASGSGATGGPSVIDSPDAAMRVLRNMGNDIRRVSEFLARQDPGNPTPYLVARGIAWGSIRQLPPDKDGVTPFPAPDANIQACWDKAVQAGNWSGLLGDAEPRIMNAPLWLDINYYVALALENLGHEEARTALTDQCVSLLRRFPRLIDFQYQDGRGFATEETKNWLRNEMAARAGFVGGGSEEGPPVDPFVEGSKEIRSLAARGKLVEAVRAAQKRIEESTTPRDRFRWRLVLSNVCLDGGQPSIAAVQLNSLDREIETHGLEEWEPELSLEVLQTLYKCEKKLGQNGHRDSRESLQRMDRLYERLCRIDILSALALEGKK